MGEVVAVASSESSADLIVIGSGAAGLTGALVAAIGGARVIVLEKADLIGGTTAISGGGAWIPCNRHIDDVGVTDSREEALEYLRACSGEGADDDILVAIVDHGAEMVALPRGRGRPAVPGLAGDRRRDRLPPLAPRRQARWPDGRDRRLLSSAISAPSGPTRSASTLACRARRNLLEYYRQSMHLDATRLAGDEPAPAWAEPVDQWWRGTALIGALLKACLDRGRRRPPVDAGRRSSWSRTAGSSASSPTHGDEQLVLRAPHVLMATGGYTHNEELKKLWLKTPIVYTCDVDSNEGDGHLMGMAAGAQTAGLGDAWWMPHVPMAYDSAIFNAAGTREDRHPPAHDDGEPGGQAVHERGGELLRRGGVVRQQGRRGAAQLPRLAAVRPAGRREVRDPRVQDPARRHARVAAPRPTRSRVSPSRSVSTPTR